MKEYETRPPNNTVRRWRRSRKTFMRWYDQSKSYHRGKNITGVATTMDRLYCTHGVYY